MTTDSAPRPYCPGCGVEVENSPYGSVLSVHDYSSTCPNGDPHTLPVAKP